MALDPKIRINLDRSVVLLVEQNAQAMDALTAMFRGFGVRKQFKATSGAEAMHIVKTQELDLVVADARQAEGPPELARAQQGDPHTGGNLAATQGALGAEQATLQVPGGVAHIRFVLRLVRGNHGHGRGDGGVLRHGWLHGVGVHPRGGL